MLLVERAEPYVSAVEVHEDGPAIQQPLPLITWGEVLNGVVGGDQEPAALPHQFCIDGKGRFVVALAVLKKQGRQPQGFCWLQHVPPMRRSLRGAL